MKYEKGEGYNMVSQEDMVVDDSFSDGYDLE